MERASLCGSQQQECRGGGEGEGADLKGVGLGGFILLEPDPERNGECDEPDSSEAEAVEHVPSLCDLVALEVVHVEGNHENGCSHRADEALQTRDLDDVVRLRNQQQQTVVEAVPGNTHAHGQRIVASPGTGY
eukprot:1123473-Rhodomonas_salina.1